jgi:hypothetical protein
MPSATDASIQRVVIVLEAAGRDKSISQKEHARNAQRFTGFPQAEKRWLGLLEDGHGACGADAERGIS